MNQNYWSCLHHSHTQEQRLENAYMAANVYLTFLFLYNSMNTTTDSHSFSCGHLDRSLSQTQKDNPGSTRLAVSLIIWPRHSFHRPCGFFIGWKGLRERICVHRHHEEKQLNVAEIKICRLTWGLDHHSCLGMSVCSFH